MTSRRPQVTRDAVLTHWVGAALRGLTAREAAEQIGMTKVALQRAVQRARSEGDPRAISNASFVVREYVNWERDRDSRGWFLPNSLNS